jgi:HK97 family phage portal protein
MALFARLFNKTWSEWDDRWYTPLVTAETIAGPKIDNDSSMAIPAVWACVRLISEDIAKLPLHFYRRLNPRGKEKVANSPNYALLHDQPNPEMTAMSFREAMMAHLLLWGNCYAEKEMNQVGQVKALWPISPDRVQAYRDSETQEIHYEVRLEGNIGKKTLPKDAMFHAPGLSYNGIIGLSPIGKLRESLGLTMAAQEFGSRFYGAGTHPGVVVSHPGRLSPEAQKNLKFSLTERYAGLGKAHRLLLLEEAMKIEKIGIPPNEAQFLETRKFQITEVARIYRVPPHKLADLERATFSNIEHQSLEYVVDTLMPWLVRLEQAYKMQLLPSALERRRYFWEHSVDGLLRGDIKSRYDAYAIGRNWGWLSANDIREKENMNPLPDEFGDDYLIPLNMKLAEEKELIADPEPAIEPNEPESSSFVRDFWRFEGEKSYYLRNYHGLFASIIEAILSREAVQLKRLIAKEDDQEPGELLRHIHSDEFEAFVHRKIAPALNVFVNAFLQREAPEVVRETAQNYLAFHKNSTLKELHIMQENGGLREGLQIYINEKDHRAENFLLALINDLKEKRHGQGICH